MDSLRTSSQRGEGLVLTRSSGRLVILQGDQELLLSDQLRYVPRLAGDELQDGSLRWKIERKAKDAVCAMVASHRLGLPEPDACPGSPVVHAYLQGPCSWWTTWLQSKFAPDEVLLASLPTGERTQIESRYDGRESVDVYWVWTTARVFLAWAGRLGDSGSQALSLPATFESGVLKGTIVCEDQRHFVSGKYAKTIECMQALANHDPWLWPASLVALVQGTSGPDEARRLADSRAFQGHESLDLVYPLWQALESSQPLALGEQGARMLLPLWSLFQTYAKIELEPPNNVPIAQIDTWLAQLDCESLGQDACFERPWPVGRTLARLCLAWREPSAQDMVTKGSQAFRESVIALLDQVAKGYAPIDGLDDIASSLARVCVLARLYKACEAPRKAHACYVELMQVLPGAQDLELVLGQEDAHAPLRHLLDALVHQALRLWPNEAPERSELLELAASLVPLDLSRVQAWMDDCSLESEQGERLRQVSAQLQNLGQNPEPPLPQTPEHALRPADLQTRLVHPAARTSNTGSLQAMLAKLERPDHSALKKYCDPGQEGVLAKEIERVARLFDKDAVGAFISHGERRYGIQAYEGDPAFLLVGGEHRRPDSAAFLRNEELRFALGAELAHLYLGHARVTSQEVLSGAFDKGKLTFELLTSLVPFLSAFPWGKRLGQLAGYFDNKLVSRSASRIREYFGSSDEAGNAEMTLDRSVGLIAAHRMMQLTADRAGLLCSGDLGACIMAMWKLRPESLEHLELLRTQGVTAAAKALSDADDDLWRALATRAAALTAFSWSQEYQELRAWCWGATGAMTGRS